MFGNTTKENLRETTFNTAPEEHDIEFITTLGVDKATLPTKFVLQQELSKPRDAFENYKGQQWARLAPIYKKFADAAKAKTPSEFSEDLDNIIKEIKAIAEQFPLSS